MADSKLCAGCLRGDEDITAVSWCSDCCELVCKACSRVHERMSPPHKNCKSIFSIEKAARGVKDGTAISDLQRRISNICKVTENRCSQSHKTLVDLQESRTKIKTRVSEIKQKVIDHLDTLEAEMHKYIDSKYKHCTESVSRNKNSIQSSTDSLSTWKSDLNSLKQQTSEIHLFQVVKYLDAKIYEKEMEIREFQKATVPILKYNPSESLSKV
ncbi:Hypothetical predicted protein [Mytilus galloprovincialis]|uniref:B box-type domain-containing protein n=1 Tax=Mytilus galloprovincialis TaxID=29158 RepID=A0A8B6DNR0_MYTGA|nr:Hypothetical predicted protein [Mytilus galloprovincialis]